MIFELVITFHEAAGFHTEHACPQRHWLPGTWETRQAKAPALALRPPVDGGQEVSRRSRAVYSVTSRVSEGLPRGKLKSINCGAEFAFREKKNRPKGGECPKEVSQQTARLNKAAKLQPCLACSHSDETQHINHLCEPPHISD